MESEPFPECEAVSVCVFVEAPCFGKSGNYVVFSVMGSKPRKEQQIDLAVLVKRRVDSSIVTAAINQSVAVHFILASASCKHCGCDHDDRQHQGQ